MSDLDSKLREIRIKQYDSGYLLSHRELEPEEIAQIKQAFADEGYLQIQTELGMDTFFTGKQWYDRFIKELPLIPGWQGTIEKAAKKAAGLE